MSMGGKRRRSASQLRLFRECPEKFRLTKLERIPQQESAAAIQGSAVHYAAERWEVAGRPTDFIGRVASAEFDRLVRTTAAKAPIESWRVWGKATVEEDIASRRAAAVEQAELVAAAHRDIFPIELPDGSPAVEISFRVDIGPCEIVGSIDRINEHPEAGPIVEDLKTGTREHTPVQLGIYAMAARAALGEDTWQGTFFYAKDGKFSKPYDLSRFTREYLAEQFSIMEDAINKKLLFPSPGAGCFTCPVKKYCRELGWKHFQKFSTHSSQGKTR
jgi:CRISPR/Cas system-associated exonuclease Cas4 (RecB family)